MSFKNSCSNTNVYTWNQLHLNQIKSVLLNNWMKAKNAFKWLQMMQWLELSSQAIHSSCYKIIVKYGRFKSLCNGTKYTHRQVPPSPLILELSVTYCPLIDVLWWTSFQMTTFSWPVVLERPIVNNKLESKARLRSWRTSRPSLFAGRNAVRWVPL